MSNVIKFGVFHSIHYESHCNSLLFTLHLLTNDHAKRNESQCETLRFEEKCR